MSAPLVVEQVVPKRAAEVWPLWLSAEGLARWWWPHLPDTTYEVDARPRGRYRIESATARIGVQGELLELDEPRLLVLTWQWLDAGAAGPLDRVHVSFDEGDATTLVRVTHEMAGEQEHGGYRQGWSDVLGRLADLSRGNGSG